MAKQSMPDCCRQKRCSCPVFELLPHGVGNHAAGILTFGKRSSAAANKTFQSRLYRLLHGSNNQAAGILTMGKRASELVPEKEEGVPITQLTLELPAAGPDPAKSYLAPLGK